MSAEADVSIEQVMARMLRKQLWVVITRAVKPPEEVRKHLKAHLAHQIRLEKDGIMYGAGPATAPGAASATFGLIIIRAKDEAEARRIADADPMHASGVRTYELYSWSLNEGRINMTLDFPIRRSDSREPRCRALRRFGQGGRQHRPDAEDVVQGHRRRYARPMPPRYRELSSSFY